MPSVEEILNGKKKKFKKTNYRPWNFLEDADVKKIDSDSKEIEYHQEAPRRIEERKEFKKKLQSNDTFQEDQQHYISTDTYLDQIGRLTGYQKKIFAYVLERCMSRGMLTTGMVTNESLSQITSTSRQMVKTSISRLIEKGLIYREKGKSGRGGFFILRISEGIRAAGLEHKRKNDFFIEYDKKIDEALPEIKNLVTPEGWIDEDIDCLKDIGFTFDHVQQLLNIGISTEKLKESILFFAYDLKYNNKTAEIKKSPLNYFIGILRKSRMYIPPDNYESPEEKTLRLYIEKKEQAFKIKEARLNKAFNLAFEDWYSTLNSNEKDIMLPSSLKNLKEGKIKIEHFKSVFREKHWPKILDELS